jgi:hypothetical protein
MENAIFAREIASQDRFSGFAVAIAPGRLDGRPVNVMTVSRAREKEDEGRPLHASRTVISVDRDTKRVLRMQSFDRLPDGHDSLAMVASYDYGTRPQQSRFDPKPFLDRGYHRYECWPDEKRRLLLDRDGHVIGKL